MSCKPETEKQRLERIAVALMAGMLASEPRGNSLWIAGEAISAAQDLIKQLDALVLDE